MRYLFIPFVLFALIIYAPSVHAACPTGCSEATDGNCYSNIDGVTACTSQTTPPSTGATLINPLGSGSSLSSFLANILAFVIRIGTVVVILMLVFVGFKFVTAQGSDTKITEARQMLLWTVVGALILLGAQAIAIGIEATVKALGG